MTSSLVDLARQKWQAHTALPLAEQFMREWIAFAVLAVAVYAVVLALVVTL